jgi:PAS domain S-box-containing protein
MTRRVRSQLQVTSAPLPVATAALASGIFVADTIVEMDVAVAVLYVAVVLMAARFCRARSLILVALGCAVLTVLSDLVSRPKAYEADAIVNTLISLVTIGLTTFLALRSQSAEARLREQAGLLALTHDTIFVRDMDDVIAFWNRGAEELYGWSSEEAIGKVTHQLMQTMFPAPLEEINAELLRTDRWEGELVHTKRDGKKATVSSRWSLHRDEQGRPAMILETNNDITERKQAEQALHQAQAELAHVSRLATIGELTASIAHEVRQPLTAVISNSNAARNWLARQPPELDQARECLRRIVRDCNRAEEVLTRVRSLVKKSPLVKARLDLNEAIQEVLAIVGPEARRYAVLVRRELAAGLPPVQGDRVQLQQVILNLVVNGIQAMHEIVDRPRELRICSRAHEAGAVLIAVQDNGIGLTPEELERVFEAFYTTKPKGMGIGLSISRSIIEAHGGRLWASANQPHGTIFQFTMPAHSGSTS